MEKEDAFLVEDVEGGLCVDYTNAEIVGRCYSGRNKDKGKDSLKSKYMAEDALSKKFPESDKGKGKEVGGPSVNMTEEAFYVKVDSITWWIDFGATTHVCKDRCWFKTYEQMEDGFVLFMGDDHFAAIHGKGSVALKFSFGKLLHGKIVAGLRHTNRWKTDLYFTWVMIISLLFMAKEAWH
nr:zinc finger, CCHC-type [Tanacetum cinerariifolium]